MAMPAARAYRNPTQAEANAYVRCRGDQHWFEVIAWSPDICRYPTHGVLVVRRCVNCTTHRLDTRSYDLRELWNRRYVYPDGYRQVGTGYERRDWTAMWISSLDESYRTMGTSPERQRPVRGGAAKAPVKAGATKAPAKARGTRNQPLRVVKHRGQ